MFSNDQNIEYIAQFVEEAKQWFDLKTKYTRLTLVDKVVRIITSLILVIVISVILVLSLLFFSLALSNFLGQLLGNLTYGFLCVGAAYLILLIIAYNLRHALIERPLVYFLMSILAEDIDNEENAETKSENDKLA
ncbi:MAG: phage holin family protein [Prevotella sp.]|nr:phage holin family protein [Prevotella sp.]MBQ9561202.1 phage holin family protein [Prevotella sp.]